MPGVGGIHIGLGGGGGAGTPTPMTIAGLVAWYDAAVGVTKDGSNRVSAWASRDGGGDANKTASQATGGIQPLWNSASSNLNSKPSLTFAKSRGDLLKSGTWGTALPNPATILIAGYLTSRPSSNYGVVIAGTAAGSHAVDCGPVDDMLVSSGTIVTGGTVPAGTAIVSGGILGASAKVYVNAQTPVATGNSGAGTMAVSNIGNVAAGGTSSAWDGEIAEILCYNVALSAGNVNTLLAYLGTKYGITIGA